MKHIVLYLLFVVVARSASPDLQPEEWPLATIFPSVPTITTGSPSKMDSYFGRARVKKDGVVYGLQRSVFIERPDNIERGYQGIKEFLVKSNNGKLIEEEHIIICGTRGLRYIIECDDGASRVEFRHVVIEIDGRSEEYLFMLSYPASACRTDDMSSFLEKSEIRKTESVGRK